MQGRALTLLQSAAGAMIPLNLAVAGPLADVLGVQAWFLIAGIAMAGMRIGARCSCAPSPASTIGPISRAEKGSAIERAAKPAGAH